MFDRLIEMFMKKNELDRREKANLADDLEPGRPGEVDPSILKTVAEPIADAELDASMDQEEMKDDKKEKQEVNASEKLRDELFKKFKMK